MKLSYGFQQQRIRSKPCRATAVDQPNDQRLIEGADVIFCLHDMHIVADIVPGSYNMHLLCAFQVRLANKIK